MPRSQTRISLLEAASALLVPALICVLVGTLFGSCETPPPPHENVHVNGNTPPYYGGVSSVKLNAYVNKMYIDMLGRGPTLSELESAADALRAAGYHAATRDSLALALQSSYEWAKNLDASTKAQMINGKDSVEIDAQIAIYDNQILVALSAGDTTQAQRFEQERDDLMFLLNAGRDLHEGIIDIAEFHRRHVMNRYYDEINMGSENFVLATFENLFHRSPTEDELEQGVLMCDGLPGFLFAFPGASQRDFAVIAVSTQHYQEGLVLETYSRLLARTPNSNELGTGLLRLAEAQDFRVLQRDLLTSTEYAGF